MAHNRPSPIEGVVAGGLPRRRERIFARAPGTGLNVRNDSGTTEIEIFGEIGFDGLTASAFSEQLRGATGDVVLKINSPGGSVFDGIAIYNLALAYPGGVKCEILSVAASAASIIAMAGNPILIAPNAQIMVHRCWGITCGNVNDHTEQAAVLDKIDWALARTYSSRTGMGQSDIIEMMDAQTWLDADESVNLGFATGMMENPGPVARFDLSAYGNAPTALNRPVKHEPSMLASKGELESLLQKAGLARAAAKKVAAGGWAALANEDQSAIDSLAIRLAGAANKLDSIMGT